LFQNQYGAQIDRIARDFGSVKEDINSTRDDINALKQHDIHPLQIAYNNLDFRMNNLTTEHLARQILGQLDAHIRGSEKHITTLELRVQELERRAANGEGSTISKRDFEESLQKIKNELIDLNNELMKEQMKLRTELDTNHSKWQMVKADVESSKTYVSAAMGSLRLEVEAFSSKMMTIEADLGASKAGFTEATKSLRAEVDSIVSTLKTIQDDSDTAKNTFREAKAIKANSPEKRRIESPGPIKTNGHKKRRARRSISDSEDDI
jgi:Rad3-related DNA helicase